MHSIWKSSKTVKKKSPSIAIAPGVYLSRFSFPSIKIKVDREENKTKEREEIRKQEALLEEQENERKRAMRRAEERRRSMYYF